LLHGGGGKRLLAFVEGDVCFDRSVLARLAPLPIALKLLEREGLLARTALALDLGDPGVFAAAECSDVSGDQFVPDSDEAFASSVASDGVLSVFVLHGTTVIEISDTVNSQSHLFFAVP
jgi:hypothetical protein